MPDSVDKLDCVSVSQLQCNTIHVVDEVSKLHTVPLKQWIREHAIFKFWGDTVDKKQ